MHVVDGHVRSAESLLPPFAPTLPNVVRYATESFGEKEFLVGTARRLTFRQADEESRKLALGLLALGVGKGTRVGIMMANSPDWILCWLAADASRSADGADQHPVPGPRIAVGARAL